MKKEESIELLKKLKIDIIENKDKDNILKNIDTIINNIKNSEDNVSQYIDKLSENLK